jgi:WD40 repeat protein
MTIAPRAGRAAAALAAITLVGAAQPAPDWMLYRAAIAAASGALRLHETSDAKRWLADAPAAHRGWEWRYLNGLADESVASRKAHDAAITGLAASPDGRLLATTSADQSVKLWDAQSGAPVATLAGHTAATWSPAFRPGGAHLAAATWTFERGAGVKGWLHLWDFEKNALLWKAEYGVKPIVSLAFHPGGTRFAAGTRDGWVGVFPVDGGGKPAAEVKQAAVDGSYPAVQAAAYAPDGSTLAVAFKDNMVRLYDARTAGLRHELRGHPRWANAVAFGPGGAWLASGSSDETLRIWDAATGRERWSKLIHQSSANAVAWSPDGARLVSGGNDGRLQLVNAADGAVIATWETVKDGRAAAIAWSADGRTLAVAPMDSSIRLLDAR